MKCVEKKPRVYEVKQILSEADYDGFEKICAYSIPNMISFERHIEEKYTMGSDFSCEFADDGHCHNTEFDDDGTVVGEYLPNCEHRRRIGYVKVGSWDVLYPALSDYVVYDNLGRAKVYTEEEFKCLYDLVEEQEG